jgi:Family of unknown function (DUF5681)
MRFQPGQSGNPAGRPPNKKTVALDEAFAESAHEILADVVVRAKNGEPAAMRMCMDRILPLRRNQPVAIEVPVIKTPEDAELALAVVTDELAAGKLTISEVSALITVIDRMLRLAERMWKYQQARLEAASEQQAPEAAAHQPQTAEKPAAPLYSPVNSRVAAGADAGAAPAAREAGGQPAAPRPDTALPRAA